MYLSRKLVEPGVVLLLLLCSPSWSAFQALEYLVQFVISLSQQMDGGP